MVFHSSFNEEITPFPEINCGRGTLKTVNPNDTQIFCPGIAPLTEFDKLFRKKK